MNGRCVSDRQYAADPRVDRWLFLARAGAHCLDACRALWCSVLARAVEDLASPHEKLANAASYWLRQSSGDPGSFDWVCSQLDLDPEAIRERLFGSDECALQRMRERSISGRLVGAAERRIGAA